jgi:phosphate transport system protein
MERRLDQDLDRVRQALLRMGGMVEGMVAKATRSLLERDARLSDEVIEADNDVDHMEIEIDEICHLILGTKQPAAVDLRFLVAVMKINSDLERIGDSAVNIAQSVLQLNDQPPLKPYIDLPHLSELCQAMVHKSLDAFVRKDARLATEVCGSDDAVDGLYKQIFRELLTYMIEDPKTVSRALHLLLISRNLERIADHATNIAEDVIYYVEGRDIRHSGGAPSDAARKIAG